MGNNYLGDVINGTTLQKEFNLEVLFEKTKKILNSKKMYVFKSKDNEYTINGLDLDGTTGFILNYDSNDFNETILVAFIMSKEDKQNMITQAIETEQLESTIEFYKNLEVGTLVYTESRENIFSLPLIESLMEKI